MNAMGENCEDYCARFINQLLSKRVCDWCKHPVRPAMKRVGLCHHCYRLRKRLELLETDARAISEELGEVPRDLESRLSHQRWKVEDVKREGLRYGTLSLTDTKLEEELDFLGQQITVGMDIFYGFTYSLNLAFCPNQRRYVFYLLSLMSREIRRKKRGT